ncbi:MAG: PAS domain-containing sensor histidine kinase, partial [Bryocella sp.]
MSKVTSDSRILGHSGVATLIRETDWSPTALGPLDTWSDTLLTVLNLMLSAPVPMQLFWGSKHACLYNDAMMPTLAGKHPQSFGKPACEVWAEAWDAIGTQIEQVHAEA